MAYSPASNLIADHGHAIQDKFYAKMGLDVLSKKTRFHVPAEMDELPLRSGRTVQWFRDAVPATNTTATTEGTVGTGQTGSGVNITATVAQYADFMTFSDAVVDVALDGRVAHHAKSFGYRGALTCDTIYRNVIDSAATAQTPLSGAAGLISKRDFAAAAHLMQGVDIQPLDNGFFFALAHPYVTYDLTNNVNAGELLDLAKYTNPGQIMSREDRGFVARFNQVELWESTNVTVTAGSPDTYRAYVIGKGAYGIVDLAGRGPSKVTDAMTQGFNVIARNNIGPDKADPEGKIRAFVSYNFWTVAVSKDSANVRMRKIDSSSSIAA